MACKEIIHNGRKYSEEDFLDAVNGGKIKPLTDDLRKPKYENFSHITDFGDRYKAIADRKAELQEQGAQISNLTDKGFNWLSPEEDSDLMFQADTIVSSKASDKTVKEVTDWFKNTGVDLKKITEGLTDTLGNPLNINEAVDVLNKVVWVADGKENVAIPEAGMHIVARIVKEQFPTLFKQMMKEINSFKILDDVVRDYKGFKNYQLPDGKPDMAKMKEEAISKVLAEYYISDKEGFTEKPELLAKVEQVQSWWGKIKSWLKDFFQGNPLGTEKTRIQKEADIAAAIPFKEVIEGYNKGDYTKEGVSQGKKLDLFGKDTFFQDKIEEPAPEETKGKTIYDRIKAAAQGITKTVDEKGNSGYLVKDTSGVDVKPQYRPSDFSKAIYEKKLGKRESTSKDIVLRETGTRLHGYIDDSLSRWIDPDTGLRRATILPDRGTILPGEEGIYNDLQDYVTKVLDRFDKDTRFLHEISVYKSGSKGKPGKDDIAGTMDFLAIKSNGAVANLDWKFMNNTVEKDDITSITVKAHKEQLGWYSKILEKAYGVDKFDESATIPFKVYLGKGEKEGQLQHVDIGDPDYKNINTKTLLPVVGTYAGIPGDRSASKLAEGLHKLWEKFYNEPVKGIDRYQHEKRLESLEYATRAFILKGDLHGVINEAFTMIKSSHNDIKEVKAFLDSNDITPDKATEAGALLYKITDAEKNIEIFQDMHVVLNDYIKDMPAEEKEEIGVLLDRISNNVKNISNEIASVNAQGLEKIANAVDIYNILAMDKELSPDQNLFNTYSNLPVRTMQVLYKYNSTARHKADLEAKDIDTKLGELSKAIQDDMMGGTWDNKKLLDMIAKKDVNGHYRPSLVNKTSSKFYEGLKEAVKNKDTQWIHDKVDIPAYKQWYKDYLEKVTKEANDRIYDAKSFQSDPALRKGTLDQELREKNIQWVIDNHDIDRVSAISSRNWALAKFPMNDDSAWSDQYIEMKKPANKPALDLYEYIIGMNKRAHESGMLGDYFNSFLPSMKKKNVDHIVNGAFKKVGRNFISNFIVEEGERRYRDPLTGEIVNNIRGKYTYDLGVDGDYSNVSTDIMKALTNYAKEITAFEQRSKIDPLGKALLGLERSKDVLVTHRGKVTTDITGKPIGKANRTNVERFEKVFNYIQYGEKLSDEGMSDRTITIEGKEFHIDSAKAIDSLVNALTIKSLGLNPMTPLANLFGGSSNAFINSGRNFTRTELAKAYNHVLGTKFHTEEGAKLLSLLDHFVPLTEAIEQHLGKHASKQKTLDWLSGEGLMVLMRKSDNIVQMANADVYFQNTMIENGKFVNIREYVREMNGYDTKFNLSKPERVALDKKMEQQIQELQKTRNLYNDPNIKYSDKNYKIDWSVPRLDDSEAALREKIQVLTRNCLGNKTPDELAGINNMFMGSALMQFRNWIPRLTQRRFGRFQYHADSGAFEAGKVRMLGDVLNDHMNSKIHNFMSLVSYANGGEGREQSIIDIAKRQYQRRIQEARTVEGTEDTMFEKTVSEAEFIDTYLSSVKSGIREIQAAAAMAAMFYAALYWAQSMPKDDDNYPERGMAKWSMRMLDKFSDELGFFYSIGSAESIIGSGNIMPMVSAVKDLGRFTTHLAREGYYDYTGDEKAAEKNKVIKYPINYIPVVNQFSSYFGIVNKEWATIMGQKPDYTYGAR